MVNDQIVVGLRGLDLLVSIVDEDGQRRDGMNMAEQSAVDLSVGPAESGGMVADRPSRPSWVPAPCTPFVPLPR